MKRNECGWRSRDAIVGLVLMLALCGVDLTERVVSFLRESGSGTSANLAQADEPKSTDSASAKPESTGPNYDREIAPVLKKYCFDCHGAEKQRAGLALHEDTSEQLVIEDRKTWEKVVHFVQAREMPPVDRPQPTEAERLLLIGWIEGALSQINCELAHDPGRVTIRRLNRVEYNNTIRDLVGVDFQPAEDFPSDDVGYGFDNIGDVLSLPTLLLEKYLSAAERIGEAAIVTHDPVNGPVTKFEASDLEQSGRQGGTSRNGVRILSSVAQLTHVFNIEHSGEYVIRSRAYGQQAGDEPAKMAFQIDGKTVHVADVTAVEEEPAVYKVRLKFEEGNRKIGVAFINDFYNPKDPDPKNRDRNLAVFNLEVQGPIDESALELPASHRRIITRRPVGNGSDLDQTCREVLSNLLKRSWRRPVTPEEVTPYVDLAKMVVEDGETFEKGIQIALEAILVSPQFLFRLEQDPPASDSDEPQIYDISEFELATRLSYFLWSSMPDDELFALAERGELRKEGVLNAQVRRMLLDPKSRSLVDNFAGQWLQLRNLKTFSPDPDLFPAFDESLREAMIRETELFFAELLRENRSVLDFLDADFTFVNERLAKHYGIDNISGDEFQRVQLKGNPRGGLLTQASFLTVTSNPTRTSPVKRGKWVLDNLLGAPPPPPPPGVEELSEESDVVLSGSLRQRMEQHRANPNCAICHLRMDAIGFGLENFDAIGSWRTRDGNFEIDPAGTLPSGESFKTPRELKSILKNMGAEFTACLSEKMLTYALGRGLEYYDKCALDEITGKMAENDYRFSVLIQSIVHSDPFQKRRGKRGEL